MREVLEILANVASILTALVAVGASIYYWCDRRQKRRTLEKYLKTEKENNPARHVHTALHLTAKLGLTKADILRASFSSRHVGRKEHVNYDTKLTDEILFEYKE